MRSEACPPGTCERLPVPLHREPAAALAPRRADRRRVVSDLPSVGQDITEGMGLYRVIALAGGSLIEVESHTGIRLTIDWTNSGYRDPRNAWRLARVVLSEESERLKGGG